MKKSLHGDYLMSLYRTGFVIMDTHAINKGVLQRSILRTRKARHQTHSKDVGQPARHLRVSGIWINGGTDEAGQRIRAISGKERRAVQEFLAQEEQDIARKYQTRVVA